MTENSENQENSQDNLTDNNDDNFENGKIFENMAKAIKCIVGVKKGKKNKDQNYAYRAVHDIINSCHYAMSENGIFVVPKLKEILNRTKVIMGKNRNEWTLVEILMTYRFYTTDGSYIETESIGVGLDNSDKYMNKAFSYAYKYCLIQTFCIPTEDMEQPDSIHKVISKLGNNKSNNNKSSSKSIEKEVSKELLIILNKKDNKIDKNEFTMLYKYYKSFGEKLGMNKLVGNTPYNDFKIGLNQDLPKHQGKITLKEFFDDRYEIKKLENVKKPIVKIVEKEDSSFIEAYELFLNQEPNISKADFKIIWNAPNPTAEKKKEVKTEKIPQKIEKEEEVNNDSKFDEKTIRAEFEKYISKGAKSLDYEKFKALYIEVEGGDQ